MCELVSLLGSSPKSGQHSHKTFSDLPCFSCFLRSLFSVHCSRKQISTVSLMGPDPKSGQRSQPTLIHGVKEVCVFIYLWPAICTFDRLTAITKGWNGHQDKSQHRKSTPENKILRPLLPRIEPVTFPFPHPNIAKWKAILKMKQTDGSWYRVCLNGNMKGKCSDKGGRGVKI